MASPPALRGNRGNRRGESIVCLTASAFRTGALQSEITQLNMFDLTVCCAQDKWIKMR